MILGGLIAAQPAQGQSDSTPKSPGEAVTESIWLGHETWTVRVDSLALRAGQVRIPLTHGFIAEVISIRRDGVELVANVDVTVSQILGFLALAEPGREGESLVVRYRIEPAAVIPRVQLHEPIRAGPAADDSTTRRPPSPWAGRDTTRVGLPPPGALRIQGSKSVSVQGGSNRDATVDQALRLTVQGELAPGIGVRAEISDENLPITPLGNTEELSDLDQVRIELFGPRGRTVLGDFRLRSSVGAFVPYERKLQGLWLQGRDERGNVSLLGGSPKGTRIEVEIRGREGVQGPYELLDGARLDQSFIVAGSERVWVDGSIATRGADRDYVIDYVRGTITFTERRPVGPENRLAVDFETSTTGYSRTVFSVGADSLLAGPATIKIAFLQEADDPNRPTDGELSVADQDTLSLAGDDPTRAFGNGVTPTEPGEGQYVERFTVDDVRFFEVADSTGGDFNVSFVRVSAGEGDYSLDRVGQEGRLEFTFVGATLGDYRIGRQLVLPRRTQTAVARVQMGERGHSMWLRAEGNLSRHDANQLSDLDSADDDDAAWRAQAETPWLGPGSNPELGRGLRLGVVAEAIGGNFEALGRIREPFFYERWNLQSEARDTRESREEVKAEFVSERRQTTATFEHLRRSGQYDGKRGTWRGSGRIVDRLGWNHRLALTEADRGQAQRNDRRDRQVTVRWEDPRLGPFLTWDDERFRDRRQSGEQGYRAGAWTAGVQRSRPRFSGQLQFRREIADSLVTGDEWKFARDIRQWRGSSSATVGTFALEADVNWRRAISGGAGDERTRLGRIRLARRSLGQGLGVDLDYRAGTEEARVLGREIVFVGLGEGDFDIEGKPVGVRQGDYNVIFTPSDSLVASINVEATAKVGWTSSPGFLGGVATEGLVQVRERSRSDDAGAVLRLSPGELRNPATTIFGERRLREELVLLRGLSRFDLRLTYDRLDVLDQQFREGPETSKRDQRRVRLETVLTRGFSLRLEAAREFRTRDGVASNNPLLQSFRVEDQTADATLRYRPTARSRLALQVRWTDRVEEVGGIDQRVAELIPSVTSDFLRGRWTVETRLVDVNETKPAASVRPFFFERPGTGRGALVSAQWGVGGSVTVTARYQLRDEPERDVRQNLSLETRARF